MNTVMQQGGFTHGKCSNCGHLGVIGSFDCKPEVLAKNDGAELLMLKYECPICKSEFVEALFPNEVN